MKNDIQLPRLDRKRSLVCALAFGSVILLGIAVQGCATAAKSAASIAASLHTAADINKDSQYESAEERKTVAGYIEAAAKANDEYIVVLGKAKAGTATPQDAINAFQVFSAQMDALQNKGLLGLKSQAAKDAFSAVVSAINVEIARQRSLVTGQTSSIKRWFGGGAAMAIAITPQLLDEIILAVGEGTELAQKLIGLKGMTDEEALAQAQADDAAAEQVAEETIAEAEAEEAGEEDGEGEGEKAGEGDEPEPSSGT